MLIRYRLPLARLFIRIAMCLQYAAMRLIAAQTPIVRIPVRVEPIMFWQRGYAVPVKVIIPLL
jgi:hypothetical protein